MSGVMLHFNEVLSAPLSCHFDHTVTDKNDVDACAQTHRHAGRDGEEGDLFAGVKFSLFEMLRKMQTF